MSDMYHYPSRPDAPMPEWIRELFTDRDLILALVAAQDEVDAAWAAWNAMGVGDYNSKARRIDVASERLREARAAITRRGHEIMREEKQGE